MSLYDALEGLYNEYGYIFNTTVTIKKEGVTAQEDMKKSMANLRENLPKQIAGIEVEKVTDYKDGVITNLKTGEKTTSALKDSNVIYFDMNDGSSLIARPSGTEPLIKIYFSIPAENEEKATLKFESYKEALTKML